MDADTPTNGRDVHLVASDWLIRLREAPGDAALQERFEAWLDEDPLHVQAWASVSDLFEFMQEARPAVSTAWPVPPRTRSRRKWLGIPGRRGRAPLLAGMAAALLAIWLAPGAMLHLRSDHVTQAGETAAFSLPDGSSVRIGPKSAIAIDHGKGGRTVRLLAGQAWFDVRHDPAAPFRVEAGTVRTTVLGTSFDVRRVGASTYVSVARGRVRVEEKDDAFAARELGAGQWLRIDPGDPMQAGVENPALLGGWRDGSLIVRDRPIADVIEELRPWYGGRILLLSPDLGRRRVDGVYDARDPARALAALAEQTGARLHRLTPWLIVIA